MSGPVITEFESLDTARSTGVSDDVFAFVPVFLPRRGETLALNRKKRIKLAVPPTFDEDRGSTRLDREVYLPSAEHFISCLGSELNVAPIV